jgi:hypothetical protein
MAEDDDDDDDGSAAHVGKANLTDTLEGDIHSLFSSKEGAWLMTGTPPLSSFRLRYGRAS